ncbi:hypothetical protein KAH27_03325 [bacterium]|nr:hypothetical protein [bacterium]
MNKIKTTFLACIISIVTFSYADVVYDLVADYGADPDSAGDSSAAFQKALNNARATNDDVTIIFPPGCYKIHDLSYFKMDSVTEKKITVKGYGIGTTVVRITGTNGFLKCEQKKSSEDLTLELDSIMFVGHSTGGTVLRFTKEEIDRDSKSYFIAKDICIFASEEKLEHYVSGGFYLSGVGNPRFINVKVDSTRATKFKTDGTYFYPLKFAFSFVNCRGIFMDMCHVKLAVTSVSYLINDKTFNAGDNVILNSFFVSNLTAINLKTPDEMNINFKINHGHIAYVNEGLVIDGPSYVNLEHILVYACDRDGTHWNKSKKTPRDYLTKGVYVKNGKHIKIYANEFVEPAQPNNSSIYISSNPKNENIMIMANAFNMSGTAINCQSVNPVYAIYNIYNGCSAKVNMGLWFGPEIKYVNPNNSLIIRDMN